MTILNFKADNLGCIAVVPRILYIDTDDTVATVVSTGYLNDLVKSGYDIRESDMALISTKESPTADSKSSWYEVSKNGNNWSVIAPPVGGDVALPSVDETLAYFTNTSGEIASTTISVNDAGAVTNIASIEIDNIKIDENTISSLNTNGSLTFSPAGNNVLDTDTVYVGNSLQSNSSSSTSIDFGTDTQDFLTSSTSRMDISSSGVRLGGANSRITTVLDEDDFASDSDTALITQQSAKAYVDNNVGGGWRYVVKTSDQTTTQPTAQNITGLNFTPAPDTDYEIEIYLLRRTNNTASGVDMSISWPSGIIGGALNNVGPAGANYVESALARRLLITSGSNLSGPEENSVPTANETYINFATCIMKCGPGVSGVFQVRFESASSGNTSTIRAGTFLKYRVIG